MIMQDSPFDSLHITSGLAVNQVILSDLVVRQDIASGLVIRDFKGCLVARHDIAGGLVFSQMLHVTLLLVMIMKVFLLILEVFH